MNNAEHVLVKSDLSSRVVQLQDTTYRKHVKDMAALDQVICKLNELDEDSAGMFVDSASLRKDGHRVHQYK